MRCGSPGRRWGRMRSNPSRTTIQRSEDCGAPVVRSRRRSWINPVSPASGTSTRTSRSSAPGSARGGAPARCGRVSAPHCSTPCARSFTTPSAPAARRSTTTATRWARRETSNLGTWYTAGEASPASDANDRFRQNRSGNAPPAGARTASQFVLLPRVFGRWLSTSPSSETTCNRSLPARDANRSDPDALLPIYEREEFILRPRKEADGYVDNSGQSS